MNKISRIIFHIDMNCFYCSCEIAENDDLKDKPVVVAHKDIIDRGIVLSPSYEARKYGIKATMKVSEAKKLCPNLVVVEPKMDLYNRYSHDFYSYLLGISKDIKVEMASCDEAYVDMSEFGVEAVAMANKIQNEIYKFYKLPCSIGIAPNKFLAKMASDMKKPMGITILRKRELPEKMWPLSIDDLMGIGKKTSPKLHQLGINTIGDLVKEENKEKIISEFGLNFYNSYYNLAYGNDDSPVVSEYTVSQSISGSNTFMEDIADVNILYNTIKVICNSIAYRLQKDKQLALNIGIQIRYNDYDTINRSKPLLKPTNDEADLFRYAKEVFNEHFDETRFVRLIGAFTNRLKDVQEEKEAIKQISIFDDFDKLEKDQKIKSIINKINKDVGKDALKKGIN